MAEEMLKESMSDESLGLSSEWLKLFKEIDLYKLVDISLIEFMCESIYLICLYFGILIHNTWVLWVCWPLL